MSTLSNLIHPIEPETFFRDYWTREPFLISGAKNKFADLFSWQALNDLLNANYKLITPPDIRMVLDTKRINKDAIIERDHPFVGRTRERTYLSPQKVQKLSERGATTIIASVHEMDRNLQQFSHNLDKEFGEESININAYFSKKGVKAFKQHYDPYDIFILQVEGRKTWHLYGYTDEYPIIKLHKAVAADAPPFTKAIEVTKGDVLYIPRGFWHAAVAEKEDSLHLTMGIICRTHTDFFTWLLNNELRHHAIFRKNLPLVYKEGEAKKFGKEEMESFLPELRAQLNTILDDTVGLAEKYNTYLEENRRKYSDTIDFPFNFP